MTTFTRSTVVQVTTSILFLLACFIGSSSAALPVTSAVVFYSTSGSFNWYLDADSLTELWSERLQYKLKNDPSWPVNATVELVDVASNETTMKLWTSARLARTDLPPVGVFLFTDMGYYQQPWFEQFKIPCILTSMNANKLSQKSGLGPGFNYTFDIEPAAPYALRSLADKYVELGVKSVVAIANLEYYATSTDNDTFSYDHDSCIRSAKYLMVPKGIELLKAITYYGNLLTPDGAVDIVKELMVLKPDAVIYCDSRVYSRPERFDTWLIKVMKDLDYTPKNMFELDLDQSAAAFKYGSQGYLDYVTQSTFYHPKLSGVDYTETSASYSSQFSSTNAIKTVADELIAGSNLAGHPSSSNLFQQWFSEKLGYSPNYVTVGIWGAIDVIEQAMYRAGKSKSMSADGIIDGEEMFDFINQGQAPTPYGRIIFDANRINTKSDAIVMQFYDNYQSNEIVAPGYLATHEFVYPMPTWSERYYKWSLMKGEAKNSIAIGSICTILLLIMLGTLTYHRDQRDIKMLYFPHLVMLLSMCLTVVWAFVFVWQGDVNQAQCNSLLWTVFLPLSFIIQLVNMKAYRLSVFLTSENKERLKKFTHDRVLRLTLGWVAFTAVLLLIAQLADPPTKREIIVDDYRPSLNYNVCSYGQTTAGILYFLFALHLLMALICVAVVRNGMEGFKDGMIMKEAFTILFACICVAYVIDSLNLDHQTNYFVRTAFIALGVTLFAVRLLFSRCAKHWVTQSTAIFILHYYQVYKSLLPKTTMSDAKVSAIEMYTLSENGNGKQSHSSNHSHSNEKSQMSQNDADEIGILDMAEGQNIDEMMSVLQDEKRLPLFRQIAEKGLLVENVDFLLSLNTLRKKYIDDITTQSKSSTTAFKSYAEEVFNMYIVAGCDQEVNVSHTTRKKIIKKMETWPTDKPMISLDKAEEILEEDTLRVVRTFKHAEKEISLMLYQNIWNKFRTAETEIQMV